ncbi:MAG: SIR2 family protein [Candidatus Hodarchaeota archaeon]
MRDIWPPRELPDIPQEVEDAAVAGSLVMFIGAGVSRLAGGPSWDEFAVGLLRFLADRRIITFGDIQQLSHLDARKQLTIASQIAQGEDLNIDYKSLLQVSENKSNIYNHINQIGCSYVTTNYDTFLHPRLLSSSDGSESSGRAGGGGPICKPQQFLAGVLREPGTVVYLHGCVDEPDSMVITTTDYLRHYDNNYVQEFLGELFEKHTVLFVGYGLEEYEILEHMLRKGKISGGQERKRFILQGFYSHQQNIYRHLYDYFKKCFGMYLISFNMDYQEHHQLEYIMSDWAPRLEVRKPALADDLRFIEEVASE